MTDKLKPCNVILPCECGRVIRSVLLPGYNDITSFCECGQAANIVAEYDGNGLINLLEGKVERSPESK